MATDQNDLRLLEAIRTTSDFQNKAVSEVTQRLVTLAERLEPLVPLLEQLIASQDGLVQRLETVTLAQVKLNQMMREHYNRELQQEQQKEREAGQIQTF